MKSSSLDRAGLIGVPGKDLRWLQRALVCGLACLGLGAVAFKLPLAVSAAMFLTLFSLLSWTDPMRGFGIFMIVSLGLTFAKTLFPAVQFGLFRDALLVLLVGARFFAVFGSCRFTLEDMLVLLFFLWGVAGIANPKLYDKQVGLSAARAFLLPVFLYFFARSMQRHGTAFPDLVIRLLILFGAANAVSVILQGVIPWLVTGYYGAVYEEHGYSPAFGLFGNMGWHNLGLFTAACGIAVYFSLPRLRGAWRWTGLFVIASAFYVLVHAYARTPLVAGIAAFVVMTLAAGSLKKSLAGMAAAALNLLLLSRAVNPVIMDHYATLHDPLAMGTWLERLHIWGGLLQIVSANLLGLGPGATGGMSKTCASSYEYGQLTSDSIYMKILVEQGIVGIALFLLLCALALGGALAMIRRARASGAADMPLLLAFSGCLLTYLISGVSVTMLELFPGNFLFWLTLGILFNMKHETGRFAGERT